MIVGIAGSYSHSQNGMIKSDMEATVQVADKHQEVIIFRSTGPWSKRWIERKHPTKNFHVKGKSSNWGPQAGLVPYNGKYSKVGAVDELAQKGTRKNDQGISSGFAGKTNLVMSKDLIDEQLKRAEGKAKRTALVSVFPVENSQDLILVAERPGDNKSFAFAAKKQQSGNYEIHVYPERLGANPYKLLKAQTEGPLEVMTSGEVGANKPMTGDYDLLAICPSWKDYGSKLARDVNKPGITLRQGNVQMPGAGFNAGVGLDNVMAPNLHTQSGLHGRKAQQLKQSGGTNSLQQLKAQGLLQTREEHPDMGNLTPRILRCITNLNISMGATRDKAPLRRVHHNAESHRNAMFGAITGDEMESKFDADGYGDGFPFTVFHPSTLVTHPATARYGKVCTLENYQEFKTYVLALKTAGYYVPKNWVWGV